MGTGNNFRRGGVNERRKHGHQIEVEKRGYITPWGITLYRIEPLLLGIL